MATRTVTIKPSGGNYTTLAAAIAAEGRNLTTDNGSGSAGILIFEISGDWNGAPEARTAAVDFDGYTTSVDYYIKVTTDAANRPTGKWDTTRYILQTTDSNVFQVREDYIWIDGIQVQEAVQTSARVFFQNVTRTSGWVKLSNSILIGDGGAQRLQIYTDTTGVFTDFYMWNCLCYGWGSHYASHIYLSSAATWYLYNNTFIWPATADNGIRVENASGTIVVTNCYSGDSGGQDYLQTTGTLTKTTCASADLTGNITSIAVNTTNFTNVTGGSEDFRIPLGSGLIGVGTDDAGSGLYSDDMGGEARASTWDVGMDEYVAAGGGVEIQAYSTYYANMRLRNKMHTDDSDLF